MKLEIWLFVTKRANVLGLDIVQFVYQAFYYFFKTREIFVDPQTQDVFKEGDVFTWLNLATTLQRISEFGADDFYTGQVAQDLTDDLQSVGSIITSDDLKNYK